MPLTQLSIIQSPRIETFTEEPVRDIRTTPVGDLHRSFWRMEEKARSSAVTDLEEAVRMLPIIIQRYKDMGEKRSAAAATVLLAQANMGLGRMDKVAEMLDEARQVFHPVLDRAMCERADNLRARVA